MTTHPARQYAFTELAALLDEECAAGYVSVQQEGPLRLYSYTDACTYDRHWTPATLMARGLILDVVAREVVATPFPKFFNYGEGCAPGAPMDPLPNEPFEVTEKMDGSLGIVFHHGGRWRVATRGSFKSEQAQWAQAWLEAHPSRTQGLQPGHTYLGEIIYPANRIVVPYTFEGLVALSGYDERGQEYMMRPTITQLALDHGWHLPMLYTGRTIEELLAVADTLKGDQEGFVVRFAGGRRVKIKGAEYCRIHKLISRVTPLAVWEMLRAQDDTSMVRRELPEEFQRDFDTIIRLFQQQWDTAMEQLRAVVTRVATWSNKDVGLWLQARPHDPIERLVFAARKDGLNSPTVREKILGHLRPTGNKLDGYTSSSSVTRFASRN